MSDFYSDVSFSVLQPAQEYTDPIIELERSYDQETWEQVTSYDATFGSAVVTYDYEALRGVPVYYRARTIATYQGTQVASDWSEATVTVAATGWNLKAVDSPDLNVINAAVLADPSYKQEEDVGIFRPQGRAGAIVISGTLGGADGDMTISARTEAEWAELEALREYQGTVLLESPFGWSRYVRFVSRSWDQTGPSGASRAALKVAFVEVA